MNVAIIKWVLESGILCRLSNVSCIVTDKLNNSASSYRREMKAQLDNSTRVTQFLGQTGLC